MPDFFDSAATIRFCDPPGTIKIDQDECQRTRVGKTVAPAFDAKQILYDKTVIVGDLVRTLLQFQCFKLVLRQNSKEELLNAKCGSQVILI